MTASLASLDPNRLLTDPEAKMHEITVLNLAVQESAARYKEAERNGDVLDRLIAQVTCRALQAELSLKEEAIVMNETHAKLIKDFGKPWADKYRADMLRYEEILMYKETLFAEAAPKVTGRTFFQIKNVLRSPDLSRGDYILLANGGPAPFGGTVTFDTDFTLTVTVHTD